MSTRPGAVTRVIMRGLQRFETWRFRRSGGTALGPKKNPQLLLTTTGRKSGRERTVALFYTWLGDDVVVIASYGGSDTHPAWYLNLMAAGKATVEVGKDRFDVVPELIEDDRRERVWRAMAGFWPAYDEYAQKTDRHIPVVALRPVDRA